jgi:outer membrane protein TolC
VFPNTDNHLFPNQFVNARLQLDLKLVATVVPAVQDALKSVALTMNQYKAGTVSYLNVITTQTIALTDETTAVQIRGQRMTAAVLLIQALGGGWHAADLPSAQAVAER